MRLRTLGAVAVGATVAAVAVAGASGMSRGGTITTIAGTGIRGFSGDGGQATSAQLAGPDAVAVDGSGNVYIADRENHRVRRVSSGGTITTIAGTGQSGFSGDGGPAASAQLDLPSGVALDGQGNIYIADLGNDRIRKMRPGGTITTFAGGGTPDFPGEDGGPATSAWLDSPGGVAVDAQGNVYFAEGASIRKVSTDGTITTIAGTGVRGFSGDGGPATAARLDGPEGVATDGLGNLYIADYGNTRVRKVNSGGTITTIAGNGKVGFSGDGGPATSARMGTPVGVAADARQNIYIADYYTERVRKVGPGGTITTIAGTGQGGFSGDGGRATSARVSPYGVAVDGQGNVYIADYSNNRVRKVGTSGTAMATYAGFYSPSRNLSCEMADRDARGSYVYCQSAKAPKNVRMSLGGRLKICRGSHCLGDPAENTPPLGYGRKITIGRFRCLSLKSGVRCTVIRSGKGFLIHRDGVRQIGAGSGSGSATIAGRWVGYVKQNNIRGLFRLVLSLPSALVSGRGRIEIPAGGCVGTVRYSRTDARGRLVFAMTWQRGRCINGTMWLRRLEPNALSYRWADGRGTVSSGTLKRAAVLSDTTRL